MLSSFRTLSNSIKLMGMQWAIFRLFYAAQKKSGIFRRRFKAIPWPRIPYHSFVKEKELKEINEYFHFRQSKSADFSSTLKTKQSGEYQFPSNEIIGMVPIPICDNLLKGDFLFFNSTVRHIGFPPDWHRNHYENKAAPRNTHWTQIGDFDNGDIKTIWDLNRFSFVYPLVRAFYRSNDEKYVEAFWNLVEDWKANNPPQYGVNWKCGQEISIRVLALIFGLYAFIDQPGTTPERVASLAQIIAVSAQRIENNFSYALSQNNNHGISEALGLWTVGALFPEFKQSRKWQRLGKLWLEKLSQKLIYNDGTFSQHSAVYHRLILDSYIWALTIAKSNGESFSPLLIDKLQRCLEFFLNIIDTTTGRVPLFGANDGTQLFQLSCCEYLDFRPTLQTLGLVLTDKKVLADGPWDEMSSWFGFGKSEFNNRSDTTKHSKALLRKSRHFERGGYLSIHGASSYALIRCTSKYVHRPSHADLLHFDLWHNGFNVLRDSGSYSYNMPDWDAYFISTAAHNTIEFDERNQMPRLSRFLFGEWASVITISPLTESDDKIFWEGQYTDWQGSRHKRRVQCTRTPETWVITDSISGYKKSATLRWRLCPEFKWRLEGNTCSSDTISLTIRSSDSPREMAVNDGWESLHYLEKSQIPVLEAIFSPGNPEIETVISFK